MSGLLYFAVHFIVEFCCFYYLEGCLKAPEGFFIIALAYDALAFVPQGVIGYLSDRFPVKTGRLGGLLLSLALCLRYLFPALPLWLSLLPLALGNAALHVEGAETTLRCCGGKMTPSAVFVSGGSFGLICGKLAAGFGLPWWPLLVLSLLLLPAVRRGEELRQESRAGTGGKLSGFDYAARGRSEGFIILAAVCIVAVRAYMGYGIPTAWNKTTLQTVALYCCMGLGKALGGLCIDRLGILPTARISILGALPLLLFGNTRMGLSLAGVLLFSMTMAVTLGVLVSVLPESPGFAFGFTTLGLFLGSLPVFFFRVSSLTANMVIILGCSALCLVLAESILPAK